MYKINIQFCYKTLFISFVFTCCLVKTVSAQNAQEMLDKAEVAYDAYDDMDSVIEYAKKTIELSEKIKDSLILGNAYIVLAKAQKVKGNLDLALKSYENAITIFSTLQRLDRMAVIYGNMSSIKRRQYLYKESLFCAEQALNYRSQVSSEYYKLAYNYNKIGLVYSDWNKRDSAIFYFKKAIKHIRLLEDEKKESMYGIWATVENNLSNVYDSKGERDLVLEHLNNASELYLLSGKKPDQARVFLNLGVEFINNQKYELAGDYFKKAERIYLEYRDTVNLSKVYYNIGELSYHQKLYKEAKEFFIKARNMYRESVFVSEDLIKSKIKSCESKIWNKKITYGFSILAIILSLMGAFFGLNWIFTKRRLLIAKENSLLRQQQLTQQEQENLETQKKLFQQKRINIQQQQELTEKEKIALQTQRKLLQTRADLVEKQRKLTIKEQQVLKSQKELLAVKEEVDQVRHDVIKSNILAIQNHVESTINKVSDDQLSDSLTTTLNIIKRLTNVVEQPLFGLGKTTNLGELVRYLHLVAESLSGMKVQLFVEIDDAQSYPVKPIIQSNIEAIVHIAFINIAKHAQCSTTSLSVTADERGLVVLIEDNGKGFDPQYIRQGAEGLQNIETRVRKVNGQYTLQTAINKGTSMKIVIPSYIGEVDTHTRKKKTRLITD